MSNHNGQARFITPVIKSTEAVWDAARPRNSERPDFRGSPPSDEQVARLDAFNSHETARAGAARASTRRVISNEEVNRKAIAEVAQARHEAITSTHTASQVAALQATVAAQAATIERLQSRLDTLESNAFAGDAT